MVTDFDAGAAAVQLGNLRKETAEAVRANVPPAVQPPLFRVRDDGSVVHRDGRELRGPVPPLPVKGK